MITVKALVAMALLAGCLRVPTPSTDQTAPPAPEVSVTAPDENESPAHRVVLVLGDSFAQGWGILNREQILQSFWPGAVSLAQTGVDTRDVATQLVQTAELIENGLVPSLVFISLGGNNLSFLEFAQSCIFASCPEIGDIKPRLEVMEANLTEIYRRIDELVNSEALKAERGYLAQILVTDYPLLFRPNFNLTIGPVQVEVGATAQITDIQLALNAAIARAVNNADIASVKLVSVEDAFTGHRLGDPTPFVAFTLHPNARGYETLLTKVAAAAQ